MRLHERSPSWLLLLLAVFVPLAGCGDDPSAPDTGDTAAKDGKKGAAAAEPEQKAEPGRPGIRGEAARAAERFAARLSEATGLEVALFDERLTSALAERRLREAGAKSRRDKGKVDQGAAVALLESWLARLRSQAEEGDRG